MCLYALGYSAICLQNEQVVLDAEMYAELANRFKDIVIFFDTDEAGFRGAISYKSLYDTNSIFIPEQLGAKDPSDLVASIGQKITKKIIKYLLRELRRNKKETDVPYR